MYLIVCTSYWKKYDNVTNKGLVIEWDHQRFFEGALFEIDLPTKTKY